MMDEKETIRQMLSAYLDGELSQPDAQRVEQAVLADPALTADLAALRATRELVHQLPREHAPEDFVSRVLAGAERRRLTDAGSEIVQRRPPFRWVRHLAAAAVFLIAAGIGTVIVVSLVAPVDFRDKMAAAGKKKAPESPMVAKEGYSNGRLAERKTKDLEDRVAGVPAKPGEGKETTGAGGRNGELYVDADGRLVAAPRSGADGDEGRRSAAVVGKGGTGGAGSGGTGLNGSFETALAKGGEGKTSAAAASPGTVVLNSLADKELANARNVEIYTDDLTATQRDVEKFLADNSFQPLAVAGVEAGKKDAEIQGRAGVYHAANVTAQQVQLVVFVEPDQTRRVEAGLKAISQRQRVAQYPYVPPAEKPLAQTVQKTDSPRPPAEEGPAKALAKAGGESAEYNASKAESGARAPATPGQRDETDASRGEFDKIHQLRVPAPTATSPALPAAGGPAKQEALAQVREKSPAAPKAAATQPANSSVENTVNGVEPRDRATVVAGGVSGPGNMPATAAAASRRAIDIAGTYEQKEAPTTAPATLAKTEVSGRQLQTAEQSAPVAPQGQNTLALPGGLTNEQEAANSQKLAMQRNANEQRGTGRPEVSQSGGQRQPEALNNASNPAGTGQQLKALDVNNELTRTNVLGNSLLYVQNADVNRKVANLQPLVITLNLRSAAGQADAAMKLEVEPNQPPARSNNATIEQQK